MDDIKNSLLVERIRVLCVERQQPKLQVNLDEDEYATFEFDNNHQYRKVKKMKRSVEESFRFSFPTSQEITYASPQTKAKRRSTNRHRNVAAHLMLDNFDALLTADLKSSMAKRKKTMDNFNEKQSSRENENVNIRFVVLWRQKQKISISEIIERNSTKQSTESNDDTMTSWITASVSCFRIFF